MTRHYSIQIVGLQYAAHRTSPGRSTADVLRELDSKRPKVMLVPERDNSADPYAVLARCGGKPIGYVVRKDQDICLKLLQYSTRNFLVASIDEVEESGVLRVGLEAEEQALKAEVQRKAYAWPEWEKGSPLLPTKEVWSARYEAEHMMDSLLCPCPDPQTMDELECYLDVWMENSLFDISDDTFSTAGRYIALFSAHPDPRIRSWAPRLEKYRTAFYGDKRNAIRMEWWESVQHSGAMERLWVKWQYHCSYSLCRGLRQIDSYLRLLPDELYSLIGTPDGLFRSLYYRRVPRQVLWGIYTALLLRIRTCQEMGIDMRPLAEDADEYGDVYLMDDEEDDEEDDVFYEELTDARLAMAVEECQSFFWAKSAWAVVFCVCRDWYGVPDHVSAFEKRVQGLSFSRPVKDCPTGTIHSALSNNSFMKKPVGKWTMKRARILAQALKRSMDGVSE